MLLANNDESIEEMHVQLELEMLDKRREFDLENLSEEYIYRDGAVTGLSPFFIGKHEGNRNRSHRV